MINNKQIKEAKPGSIKIDTPGLQVWLNNLKHWGFVMYRGVCKQNCLFVYLR